jgi:pheromone shutdown protein TraB
MVSDKILSKATLNVREWFYLPTFTSAFRVMGSICASSPFTAPLVAKTVARVKRVESFITVGFWIFDLPSFDFVVGLESKIF